MASRKLFRTRFSSARRPIDNKRRSSTARAKVRLMLEYLEDRLAPAALSDAGGTLTFVLSAGETVSIKADVNTYDFTTSGSNTFTNKSLTTPGDFTGLGTNDLTWNSATPTTNFATLNFNDSGGANAGAAITFNDSGTNDYTRNFTVALTNAGAGDITFNGTSKFTGTAALTASTTGAVTISSGATVTQNAGTLSLTAGGSLTGPTPGATANIVGVGATITLNVTGASSTIGTSGSALQIDATTLNASTAGGGIFITNTTGNLAVGLVSAGATGTGDVALTATSGSLTDADASTTADIVGATITLKVTSASSTIGTSATNPLEIDATTQLNATTADGNIDVTQTSGDLPLGSVNAGTGTVLLVATNGAITNANGTTLNITGGTVDLTATSDIGKATAIKTKSSHLVTSVSGSGKVTNITETNALNSVSATTNAGDVTINFNGGSLSFTASTQLLTASGTSTAVTFENTGGSYVVGAVSAGTGNVTLTADNGSISPGSGVTVNITNIGTGGVITAATLGARGSGYVPNATVELYVLGAGGTGGVVSVTTDASGNISQTETPMIVDPGTNYSDTAGSPPAATASVTPQITGGIVTLTTTGPLMASPDQYQIGAGPANDPTALTIDATTLVNATTDDGDITLLQASDLALGALTVGGPYGEIQLLVAGTITDGLASGENLTAVNGVTLTTTGLDSAIGIAPTQSTSAIPIQTAIGELTATTYDGGVFINNSTSTNIPSGELMINSILAEQQGSAPQTNGNNQIVYNTDANPPQQKLGTEDVFITAAGNIMLGTAVQSAADTTIQADNEVDITSSGGGIFNANSAGAQAVNVFAEKVSLVANGKAANSSIGQAMGNVGGIPDIVPAVVKTPTFSATTSNGSIYLQENLVGEALLVDAGAMGSNVSDVSVTSQAQSMAIGTIISSTGTVSLDEMEGALQSGTSTDITGQTADLTATMGIFGPGGSSPFPITASDLMATVSDFNKPMNIMDLESLNSVGATTNDGSVSITSASSGGALSFGAMTNPPAPGLLTASGAPVTFENTGAGTYGNVSVGAVNAGTTNDVSIKSDQGAITAGTGVDITGATATLNAATGIGVAPTTPGIGTTATAISTSVTTALTATTTMGDIYISQANAFTLSATSMGYINSSAMTGSNINVSTTAGGMILGSISAMGKVTLTLMAGGSITDGNGNTTTISADTIDVAADTLILTAPNGIGTSSDPLYASVDTLTANYGTGGLYLANNKSLNLGSVTTTSTSPGTVMLTATSQLTQSSGSGYMVGDVLTVIGTATTAAQLTVTSVDSNGGITGVSVTKAGTYTTDPTNPVSVTDTTTQSASGASFALSFDPTNHGVTAAAVDSGDQIQAATATLNASAIGTSTDPVWTTAATVTAISTSGDVYLYDSNTTGVTLTASAFGATLDVTCAGSIVLNYANASQTVNLQAGTTIPADTTTMANANATITDANAASRNSTPPPPPNVTTQVVDLSAPGGIGTPPPLPVRLAPQASRFM